MNSTWRRLTSLLSFFSTSITWLDSCAEDKSSRLGRRIIICLLVPSACTWISPIFSVSKLWRTLFKSAPCAEAYSTSISVPPVNSTDKFSPRVNKKITARINVANEMKVVSLP